MRYKFSKCKSLILVVLLSISICGAKPAAEFTRDLYQPSQPEMFGAGIISTGDMELNAAFTPDGQTIYFSKRTPKYQLWTILVSNLRQGHWSTPQVAEFSGQYGDNDPFISPDGSKLFFSSNRIGPGKTKYDFDIWMVEKTRSGWSEPTNVGAPVNSESQEFYPTVAANGTLYFSSNREGGKGSGDIYRSRFVDGKYSAPENLGDSINSKYFDGDPYIAPDESFLIFVSYNRPDGLGDGDLYISLNRSGSWTAAKNLGSKINSSALDFCPNMSPDKKYFFFTSERGFADQPLKGKLSYAEFMKKIHGPGNGLGDIYRIDARVLLDSTETEK